jgi:hypothetical protein
VGAGRALFPQEPTEQRVKGVAYPFRVLPEQFSAVFGGALPARNLKIPAHGLRLVFRLPALSGFSRQFIRNGTGRQTAGCRNHRKLGIFCNLSTTPL